MTWTSIFIAGFITYFTRMAMIALVGKEMLSERVKEVLAYVPSAVFPAIIFPAIFINETGLFQIEENPKILAAIIAMVIGILSRSIIATIFSGLASYWFLIFVV